MREVKPVWSLSSKRVLCPLTLSKCRRQLQNQPPRHDASENRIAAITSFGCALPHGLIGLRSSLTFLCVGDATGLCNKRTPVQRRAERDRDFQGYSRTKTSGFPLKMSAFLFHCFGDSCSIIIVKETNTEVRLKSAVETGNENGSLTLRLPRSTIVDISNRSIMPPPT